LVRLPARDEARLVGTAGVLAVEKVRRRTRQVSLLNMNIMIEIYDINYDGVHHESEGRAQ
jgi:hypothetical protein